MSRRLFRNIFLGLFAWSMVQPVLADVLVFGGTRGVGLETVRSLRAAGESVTVMVRATSDLTALAQIDGVTTVEGDALEPDSVTAAYASGEFAAVVSTLSGNPTAGFTVDSVGSINAIDGAKAAGVQRFVLVSSIGVGESAVALPPQAMKALEAVLAEKTKAEAYLVDSGLSYTIIRPGVLTNKAANGNGILSEDPTVSGIISRAECGRLTAEAVADQASYGKIYSAIEQQP